MNIAERIRPITSSWIRPTDIEARRFAHDNDLSSLMRRAAVLRDEGHGEVVTYSRKVFIPLTHLCRDVCHYCTFARPPRKGDHAFMTRDQVLEIARAGADAGCKEALFTLGDKPEARYRVARNELSELGHDNTLSYLREMAEVVFHETGLLPHLNPGLMTADDLAALRPVSASMGIMLESVSPRLSEKGMPHYGSPDKDPSRRLETIRLAGAASVPFTTGILIGIGETRAERIDALLAIRDLHDSYGHIQEIIIQNFRAKPGTKMADAPEPDLDELLWTLSVARLIFGAEMSIQAPPNLSPGVLTKIVGAGINDWGGVSPVTQDFVNPEAPWPHLDDLAEETARAGKLLTERLTIYPRLARNPDRWLDPRRMRPAALRMMDADGFARVDPWTPGAEIDPPSADLGLVSAGKPGEATAVSPIIERALSGLDLSHEDIARLFEARGAEFSEVCAAADHLRRSLNGDVVTYVVNRNINYTNVCYFKCQFCAFSKGKLSENLRGRPYDLNLEEIKRRVKEAWSRGATEVCMQGGIHPDYTGETYIDIVRAVKDAAPDIHVHAFTPLEVWQGAATLAITIEEFLRRLKDAGLGTLPGTAAEILDDEIRAVICPDKITTDQWLEVMEAAHNIGFSTTATIMYGHVDGPTNWARHLIALRELQKKTGGFTEFVPLPFVPMEAPIYLKGKARMGPTFREAVLMHAVARLALNPWFRNIQTSWVKMGPKGVASCLNAGANDVGGTLMNESITRAAGASHGQEMPPERMEALIGSLGRSPRQRTTAYGVVSNERTASSFDAAELSEAVNTPARKYERRKTRSSLVRPGIDAGK